MVCFEGLIGLLEQFGQAQLARFLLLFLFLNRDNPSTQAFYASSLQLEALDKRLGLPIMRLAWLQIPCLDSLFSFGDMMFYYLLQELVGFGMLGIEIQNLPGVD